MKRLRGRESPQVRHAPHWPIRGLARCLLELPLTKPAGSFTTQETVGNRVRGLPCA